MKTIIFMAAILMTFCLLNNTAFSQETRTHTVTNKTGVLITDVNISISDAYRWGPSLNSAPSLLISGNSFSFKQPLNRNNCKYDIRYRGGDGRLYYLHNVDLCQNSAISLILTQNYNKDKSVSKK